MQIKQKTTSVLVALGLLLLSVSSQTPLVPQQTQPTVVATDGNSTATNKIPATDGNSTATNTIPANAPATPSADANKPTVTAPQTAAPTIPIVKEACKVCVKDLKVVKNQKQFLDKELFSFVEGNFDGKVRKVVILVDSATFSKKCQKKPVYPMHLKISKNKLRNRFNVFGLRLLRLNDTLYSGVASEFHLSKIALFNRKNGRLFEPKHFDGDAAFTAIAEKATFEFERFKDANGKKANFLVLKTN